MARAPALVPITTRSLLQRINRKLAPEGRLLKATRGTRSLPELGEYYVLDTHRNIIINKHVDPIELAKKLGALRPYEKVAD